MKKLTYLFVPVIAICFAISCRKFLDREPLAQSSPETFFDDPANALKALTGAYDVLNKRNTTNNNFWRIGDARSDDTRGGGAWENFTLQPTDGDLNSMWVWMYEGITRANLVIQSVPKVSETNIPAALKDRIVGEAKFLRGFYYFYMIQLWGSVPLVLEPINPGDLGKLQMDKTPQPQIWAQIEKDLQDAATALPLKSGYGSSDVGRATKGAAQAYLAKAYLYQKKYTEAAAMAQTVIQSNQYSLVPNFLDANWTKNNSESIFEMQSKRGAGGWEDDNEGNSIHIWNRPWCLGGWGSHQVEPSLYNEFQKDPVTNAADPRRGATVFETGDSYGSQAVTCADAIAPQRWPKKVLGPPSSDPSNNGGDADHDQNWRFMRYSELLLIRAEALIEQSSPDLAGAAALINQVRDRARKSRTPASLYPIDVVPVSQAQMRTALRHERRVELATEMHRFYDLVRWGIAKDVLTGFTVNRDEVLPIPQSQIDLSGGNLKQNPGYN